MTKLKFLPIGTICELRGLSNKVMIVGYYSINYNGIVKMYDYSGILYPEGLLLKNRIISFNHIDITNIEFVGYVSDEYNKLNKRLVFNGNNFDETKELTNNIVINFRFDENGVVTFDPLIGSNYNNFEANKEVEELKKSVINPFQEKYRDLKTKDNRKNWTIFNNKNKEEEE